MIVFFVVGVVWFYDSVIKRLIEVILNLFEDIIFFLFFFNVVFSILNNFFEFEKFCYDIMLYWKGCLFLCIFFFVVIGFVIVVLVLYYNISLEDFWRFVKFMILSFVMNLISILVNVFGVFIVVFV